MAGVISASRARARPLAVAALPPLLAVVLGGLFAYTAWSVNPLMLPGVVGLAMLVAVALNRPEAGVGAAIAMVPFGNRDIKGVSMEPVVGGFIVFVFLLAMWERPRSGERTSRLPALALPSAVFLLVLFGSVLTSRSPEAAAEPVLTYAAALLVFASIALIVRRREQFPLVVAGVGAAVLFIGALAVHEHLTGQIFEQGFITSSGDLVGRVRAGFGHPNQLGGTVAMLLPLVAVGAMLYRRWWPLLLPAGALGLFALYISFSRAALIALAAAGLIMVRSRKGLLVVPLVVAAVVLGSPDLLRERFATLTSQGSEVATRVEIWTTAQSIWFANPLLGAGVGSFPVAYAESRTPGKRFLPHTAFEPPPHAHNVYLNLLSENGVLGLAVLLFLLAAAGVKTLSLRRSRDREVSLLASGLLAALVAFCVHNLFDVTLSDRKTGLFVWAVLGLVSALAAATATGRWHGPEAEAPDR